MNRFLRNRIQKIDFTPVKACPYTPSKFQFMWIPMRFVANISKIPVTWRMIFGFGDNGGHPGMRNVRQAYDRRLLDGPWLGTWDQLRATLDKAYGEAEAEFAQIEASRAA
jgi:hypothetical protein